MAEETSNKAMMIAGGSGIAILIFISGVFLKEQSDINTVIQRESDHYGEDAHARDLLQAEIDRRFKSIEERFDSGHAERVSSDEKLGARIDALSQSISQRIDQLSDRMTEVQRQTAAIEGKLGGSTPNSPGRPTSR